MMKNSSEITHKLGLHYGQSLTLSSIRPRAPSLLNKKIVKSGTRLIGKKPTVAQKRFH